MVRVRPGDDDWDSFIHWLYAPDLHGALQMVEVGWEGWEVVREQQAQGFVDGWLID